MKDTIKITFEAKIKAGIKHDEAINIYVAFAPALNLYSQGETAEEAQNAI